MGFERAIEIVNVFEMKFRWEKDLSSSLQNKTQTRTLELKIPKYKLSTPSPRRKLSRYLQIERTFH